MPHIPPPANASVSLENWDDDPAFDIPDGEPLQLASSPSSSSTSSRGPRHSLTLKAGTSSPLRQSITSPPPQLKGFELGEDNTVDDFADVPTILASSRHRPTILTSPGSSSKRKNISTTIVQSQFKGIGTITKFTTKATALPVGSVRARAKAIEQAFEDDIDFTEITELKPHRLTKALLKRNEKLADVDALDGLEIDDFEDNEATLKASATLKAQLPPRKNRKDDTIKAKLPITVQKEDEEAGFDIPSGQWVLTLPERPRVVFGGNVWDSSGTSTSGRRSERSSLFDDSPKRHSDTSATSLDSPTSAKPRMTPVKVADRSEEMEDGLDLGFFANKRPNDLTKILDRKRLEQYVPPTPTTIYTHRRTATNDSSPTGDESMEDGLELHDPRSQLTRHRLSKPSSRTSASTKRDLRPFVQDKAAQRELEQGWNRPLSSMPPPRSTNPLGRRNQSGLGSSSALPNQASSSRIRPETPRNSTREPELTKRTSRLSLNIASRAPTPIRQPSTPSRLRHQQSYSDMTPSRQQTLSRVQSHASLMENRSHHPRQATEPSFPAEDVVVYPTRYHSSTSRLLSPTKASLAKSRPPLSSVFSTSSSASSISTAGMATPRGKEKDPAVQLATSRHGEVGRGRSYWHSGAELEGIEDLPVDSPRSAKMPGQLGLGHPGQKNHEPPQMSRSHVSRPDNDKGHGNASNTGSTKRRRGVKIGTIHPMGAAKSKTVKGLTYDPDKQKWLGNDEAYRKFSPPPRNTIRPALITPFPGSSSSGNVPTISSANVRQSSATAAIRVVGDMRFDPEKMCWVHIGQEPEEDPFAGMLDADDEDDVGFNKGGGGSGGTITRSSGRTFVSIASSISTMTTSTSTSTSSIDERDRVLERDKDKDKERGMILISEELRKECKEAQMRHGEEMRPWFRAREARDRDEIELIREERINPAWEICRVAKGF
ncbi:hypothetical protein BCR39DRAFT_597905 [Naematelia encephala]|uniref:Uncharacterized protein n=1 Tax=Naematelia encephala TaxID=71784 RepID=A0A1Y2BCG3_9TREE|nr:hypothetical protein BCR39DRAFT_597905 [Naematelia encephala]